MIESFTYCARNAQVFAELCGANDYNLSLIGSLLGTHVLTRGNELFVESDDPAVLSLFSRLISAIGTSIEEGVPATRAYNSSCRAYARWKSIFRCFDREPAEEKESDISRFLDNCIQIPMVLVRSFRGLQGRAFIFKALHHMTLLFL